MSSKFASRKKNNRQSRLLQALRDFTAADTCYSDGANPLSFRIGEIFTFLSRRDNYWVNVERTVWRHNPLLKTKEYLTVERGIVPVDYIIEMDVQENEGMSSRKEENCPVSSGDHDKASHDNIFEVNSPSCILKFLRSTFEDTHLSHVSFSIMLLLNWCMKDRS